ncbi:MAG: hypothetical protein ACTSVU_00465 [Promethearchaeota archaeon]
MSAQPPRPPYDPRDYYGLQDPNNPKSPGLNGSIPPERRDNNMDRTYRPSGSNVDTIMSERYTSLQYGYHRFAKRATTIQIIGSIFVMISLFIEIIISALIWKVMQRIDSRWWLRFSFIVIILLLVTVFAFFQFLIIRQWNLEVARHHKSLTTTNYRLIAKMKQIRVFIILVIIFGIWYLYLFRQVHFVPRSPFPNIQRSYLSLLRLSAILILFYLILEFIELYKWNKRISAISRIENQMIKEIPGLDELAALSNLNKDDTP